MTHDTHQFPPPHTHTSPQIWGDVKKTSPKKLHLMAHTDRQTDGHGDSMTDPAQRAESVKISQTVIINSIILEKTIQVQDAAANLRCPKICMTRSKGS